MRAHCVKCGAALEPDSTFCGGCGSRVDRSPTVHEATKGQLTESSGPTAANRPQATGEPTGTTPTVAGGADGISNYALPRSIFAMLEVLGWGTLLLGIVLVLVGLSGADYLGRLTNEAAGLGKFIAVLPGVFVSSAALLMLTFAHASRATVDTARAVQQLLAITPRPTLSSTTPGPVGVRESLPEGTQLEYHGRHIYQRRGSYFVAGSDKQPYASLEIAKRVVDRQAGAAA